jgi:hypothetical protein
MRALKIRNWEVPAVLLWVSLLAFGILIPWLGFYADDWPYLYTVHAFGPQGMNDFISWVRPFSAWVLVASAWLLGQSIWAYHAFILVLRWLDAVLLFWLVQKIWPGMIKQAVWISLIFAIYPAFKQQTLPFEYLPHFVALAFLFLSFIIMIEAVKGPRLRVALFIISIILSLGIFIIEYFAGLELLRPILLGIILYAQSPELKRLLRRVVVYWIPYLLVFIGFVVWRVFILGFPSYKPGLVYDLKSNPLGSLVQLISTILKDLYTVTIGTWIQVFQIPTISRSSLLYLVIVLAAFLSVGAYLWWMNKRITGQEVEDKKRQRNWSILAISTGIFSLLVAGWPIWVPKIPVTLTFAWDRATLPFMVGVSLIIPGVVNLIPWARVQIVVLAVLIALSVGSMFQNDNLFRKEFTSLKQFYWELSWRAPELKKGTVVVIDESPFNYHVDTSLTPLLNWTYAPQSASLNLPYSVYEYHKIASKFSLEISKITSVQQSFFNFDFNGASSSILMIAYNPPGCLRVLTPQEGDQLLMPAGFKQKLGLSNINLILDDENTPVQPPTVLGSNPAHDWCYYFEKADLAGQFGNWQEVTKIGKEVIQASLKPQYPSELVVFIEGFAHTGDWSQAHEFAKTMVKDPFFKSAVCDTWSKLEQDMLSSQNSLKMLTGYKNEFGCNS